MSTSTPTTSIIRTTTLSPCGGRTRTRTATNPWPTPTLTTRIAITGTAIEPSWCH